MTKIQNLKHFEHFEHWKLEFGIYLLFGYCNLVLYNFSLGIFSIR